MYGQLVVTPDTEFAELSKQFECAKITDMSPIDLAQFRFDFAVIGCSALHEDGDILDFDIHEVGVSKAVIAQSEVVLLASDSSKFERKAPARIASPLPRLRAVRNLPGCTPPLAKPPGRQCITRCWQARANGWTQSAAPECYDMHAIALHMRPSTGDET